MGAVAGARDFSLQAGATWTETLTYKVNGSPVDLTSWHARLQIRAAITSDTALFTLTDSDASPDPHLVLGGVLGTIGVQMEAIDTSTLSVNGAAAKLAYGLELFRTVSGVEQVVPLLQGALSISPEVVRS